MTTVNKPSPGCRPRAAHCLAVPSCRAAYGKKHCDEGELLPLLLEHGFVRRVRAIEIDVHPLGGGDNFNISLDAYRAVRGGGGEGGDSSCAGDAGVEARALQGGDKGRQTEERLARTTRSRRAQRRWARIGIGDIALRDGELVAMAGKDCYDPLHAEAVQTLKDHTGTACALSGDVRR
jgi:hypothetical protein